MSKEGGEEKKKKKEEKEKSRRRRGKRRRREREKKRKKLGMVVYHCNSQVGVAETGRSQGLVGLQSRPNSKLPDLETDSSPKTVVERD